MSEYSEGICGDGVAILKDGIMMTPQDIVSDLSRISALEKVAEAYREYHNLLQLELSETFSIAHNHGYRSSKIVEGQNARAKIISAEQAAGYLGEGEGE